MKKRVEQVDGTSGASSTLATFELDGDRVLATWTDPDYRDELELMGLYVESHGDVRPEDGRVFFDALDAAYARSSLRSVVVEG